jgi:hypothetical protein
VLAVIYNEQRNTALIVILVVAIIGGLFFLKGKTSKNSALKFFLNLTINKSQ